MTTIAEALDEQTRARLQGMVANLDTTAPAKVTKPKRTEIPFEIVKASTEDEPRRKSRTPTPGEFLTQDLAIDIDPKSEAMIEVACVFECGSTVLINPQVPEGMESMPRAAACAECAERHVRQAIADQRNVLTIRRPQVARHQPRTQDDIDHPVTTKTKEKDVDLDNLSDAELGASVRQQIKSRIADGVPAKRKKAKVKQAKADKKDREGIKAEQKRRKGHILPAFMVGTTLEVPALDLADVSSLDEAPSAVTRSPYNKARFRLCQEKPLDPETTTFRVLASEHERLCRLAAAKASKKAQAKPKAEKGKTKVEQPIVAVLDKDTKAKVKALMDLTGLSKKKAEQIVLGR